MRILAAVFMISIACGQETTGNKVTIYTPPKPCTEEQLAKDREMQKAHEAEGGSLLFSVSCENILFPSILMATVDIKSGEIVIEGGFTAEQVAIRMAQEWVKSMSYRADTGKQALDETDALLRQIDLEQKTIDSLKRENELRKQQIKILSDGLKLVQKSLSGH